MAIKLDDNYTIEADSFSWRLVYSEEKTPASGKPYIYTENSYFISIEQALTAYCDLMLREIKDIDEILKKIKKLKNFIAELAHNIRVVNSEIKVF